MHTLCNTVRSQDIEGGLKSITLYTKYQLVNGVDQMQHEDEFSMEQPKTIQLCKFRNVQSDSWTTY